MSDFGLIRDDEDLDRHPDDAPPSRHTSGGRRGPRKRRGWIPALLVLLLIGGGLYYAGSYGFDKLKEHFAAAPDYAGPGTGSVVFEVKKGDSVAAMGRGLRRADVVKSVDAFVEAARKEPRVELDPGRLLPAEEADEVLRRPRGPGAAGQHDPDHGHRARGLAGQQHRRDDRQEDRLQEGPARAAARAARPARPAGVGQGQPGGLPLPGHLRGDPGHVGARPAPPDGRQDRVGGEGPRPRHQGRGRRHDAGGGAHHGEHPRVRGQPGRGLPQGRTRHLQPARQGHAAPVRRHGRLRQRQVRHRLHLGRGAGPRLAVQHLQEHRAASRPDRLARREDDPRGPQPVVRATSGSGSWSTCARGRPATPTATRTT